MLNLSASQATINLDMKNIFLSQLLFAGVVGVLCAVPAVANAQDETSAPLDRSFSVQLYEPAMGHDPLITIESIRTVGHLSVTAGLFLHYQHNPFSVYPCVAGTGGPNQPECELDRDNPTHNVVQSQLQADLLATLSIIDMIQIGLAFPITLYQGGDGLQTLVDGQWADTPLAGSTSLGDIRLNLKWTAPFGLGSGEEEGFGLAIVPVLTFPTGNAVVGDAFMGDGMVTVHAQVLGEFRWRDLQVGARLGYRWREDSQIYSTVVGDHLTYAVGASYNFELGRPGYAIRPMAELFGANGFSAELDQNPLELDFGLSATLAHDFIVNFAIGAGLVAAVGVPQFRIVGGFVWAPQQQDNDRDGVQNSEDQCPEEAEDDDGFEDTDGCPEPDNDRDGIDDDADRCPDDAEDPDQFEDDDGCPEPDNDGDGINDGYDSCPDEPEDLDGYQDQNGCPDLDHDGDNIPEPQDHCPYEQEDTDGFADQDGCPEHDYDGDGLGDDEGDMCPEEAEDLDEYEDEDGCPDPDNDNDMIPDGSDSCATRPESWNDQSDDDGCPDGRSALSFTEEQIRLNVQFEFESGGAVLAGRTSESLLNIIATIMRFQPGMRLRIVAFTSDRDIGQRRANNIRRALTGRNVDASRLETSVETGSAHIELHIISGDQESEPSTPSSE